MREIPVRVAVAALLGLALHLLLLVAPLLTLSLLGWAFVRTPVILFLLMATGFYVADLSLLRARHEPERLGSRKEQIKAYRLGAITGLCMLVIFWVALVENTVSAPSYVTHWRCVGGLLMGGGVCLRYLAIRRLGCFFVSEITVIPGQPLVQSGIYRFMRHPSEAGNLAIVFGACVLLGSLIGLALCSLALMPVILCRVRLEDRCLENVFGDEFRAFATRVKRLVPMVY